MLETLPPAERKRTDLRRFLGRLALSLVLGTFLVWVMRRGGIPILPTQRGLSLVRWGWLALYVPLYFATHWLRAARWRHLIRPIADVPLRETILLNWIGFFAIFLLPLRLGEMTRPALSKLRLRIPISVGLGTVAVERILDGVISSLCVVVAVIWLRHPESDVVLLRYYAYLALAGFGAAFFGLFLFLWQHDLAIALIRGTFGRVSAKLGALVEEKVSGVADGVRCLHDVRLATLFTLESLAYWFANATCMWLLAIACQLHTLGLAQCIGLMGVLAIGVLLPAAPGMFGTFNSALFVGMNLFYAPAEAAGLRDQFATYVFLLYSTQAILICLLGIIPLYRLNLSFSDLLRNK